MELEKFDKMKANYAQLMETANRALPSGEFANPSQSVWFDKKSIEALLAQTDEKTGGIKIYFGVYDKSTITEVEGVDDPKALIGKLTVILTASNDNETTKESSKLLNDGKLCPPFCG